MKDTTRIIFTIMFVIGFLVIIGTTGRADYANAVGESYPVRNMLIGIAIGLALVIPGIVIGEEDDEMYE